MEAERRQVTVLFTDMVGFTTYSERAGEDAAFTLMQSLAGLMEQAVRENCGAIRGFTGDGVLAVFGAPVAFEDGPMRACRAALAILDRLKTVGDDLEAKHGLRPQLRIGMNTGLAVVGQVQGGDDANFTVLGDTVNLAARMQAVADPGSAVMSESMCRLTQGAVTASFAGEYHFKGKLEPQKVYRLDSVRKGRTRFDTAIDRGLSAYVGREHELRVLGLGLQRAQTEIQVIDIMADAGMGKSRLIYEFRRRIEPGDAFFLSGNCSQDGQQTPLVPFIEVVRDLFQVSVGEPEEEVTRKLETGLNALGLSSLEHVGLLLNLLGLQPSERALNGLDGVLIGLRTRDLLLRLIKARCRLSPIVLLVEDLHWIDSVSEEVLGKIADKRDDLPLLLLHTRRPEYAPPWRGRAVVTELHMEPLPAGDIRRLIEGRLGVEVLPEDLAQQMTDKAEGNALFAEEIVSFLTERGELRAAGESVEFDADAIAAALPTTVQSLLTARVDRLARKDRALLQAAAVIGRRFDPELLAAVANDPGDVGARLVAMQFAGLVRPDAEAGKYKFKHGLVRDALYQSLLKSPCAALHLKIAEEVERRSVNRLAEVVDTLAYHYRQTDRHDKAFRYLVMAGAKSLGVYSLDGASNSFAAAIAILDENPRSASDSQIAEFLVDYTRYSNMSLQLKAMTAIAERFMSRLDALGDSHKHILIWHHYILGLLFSARYREAQIVQTRLAAMAERLDDLKSKAYALATAIHVSTFTTPFSLDTFERVAEDAIAAASNINDPYLQCFVRNAIAWEQQHRGRMLKAHEAIEDLLTVGRRMNDPRSIGLGMGLRTWAALVSDDYVAALDFAEAGISIARTPFDLEGAKLGKIVAQVLLRRPEASSALRALMMEYTTKGWHWHLSGADGIWGVALALRGDISQGVRWMRRSIARREQEGYHGAADWYRLFLCEIYLEIVSRNQPLPARLILRNILTLILVTLTARKLICGLIERVRANPRLDPNGHFIGRSEMILGLLYKVQGKRALALRHLTEAKRIAAQFGRTPMLARIDEALGKLDLIDPRRRTHEYKRRG